MTEPEREKMATKGFYDWNSIPLKVVDFYSIINGFDNEEQRGFALDLDRNSILFYTELKSWILSKNLAENEATFEKIMVQLAKHEVGRKELILVLSIEKFNGATMHLSMDEGENEREHVGIPLSSPLPIAMVTAFHEINHWLHFKLGLDVSSEVVGDFLTPFEKDFIKHENYDHFSQEEVLAANYFYITPSERMYSADTTYDFSINKAKALKIFEICVTWHSLEEIWTIVGFANINNTLYVNLLTDMELYSRQPVWGHQFYTIFHTSENEMLKAIMDRGPQEPTKEAWHDWLILHNLPSDLGYNAIRTTTDDIAQKKAAVFNVSPKLNFYEKNHLINSLSWCDTLEQLESCGTYEKTWIEEHKEIDSSEKLKALQLKSKQIEESGLMNLIESALPLPLHE